MAENFDGARATKIKEDIIRDVQLIRDMLSKDIINRYWEKNMREEGDMREFKEEVRKYARRAAEQLDAVIRDAQ